VPTLPKAGGAGKVFRKYLWLYGGRPIRRGRAKGPTFRLARKMGHAPASFSLNCALFLPLNLLVNSVICENARMTKLTKEQRRVIRSASLVAKKLKLAVEGVHVHPSGLAGSFVPYTILSKAFNVHEAVLTLCRAGLASEAYAVSRIMVEMYIGLRWMTNQDQNKRCEEYAQFVAARRKHFANVRELFYPAHPKTAEIVKNIDRVFGKHAARYKNFSFWSNVNKKLWGMAQESEVLYNVALTHSDLRWDYMFPYSMASDHVHATIEALIPLVPTVGEPYKVRDSREYAGRSSLTFLAVVTSTVWLLYITARVDAWRELGVEKCIDAASLPFERITGLQRYKYSRAKT